MTTVIKGPTLTRFGHGSRINIETASVEALLVLVGEQQSLCSSN